MGVNSLPKTAIRQCRDCGLNTGPSAPESSMLTTRLPSHHVHKVYNTKHTLIMYTESEISVSFSKSIHVFWYEQIKNLLQNISFHPANWAHR